MSTGNLFTQHSINTPSSPHAIQKGKVVNAKVIAPFTQRHGFSVVGNARVRLPFRPLLNRGFKSLLNAPSSLKSASDYVNGNINSGGPICNAQSFRFVCEFYILASVSVLLMPRFPSAIAFLVVAVVVYSSDGSAVEWLRSHVFKKRFERFPAIANFDSSVAVVFAMLAVGVSATIQYTCPYLIFSGVRHSVFSALALFASRCFSLPKAFAGGDFFVSAFADASPKNSAIFIFSNALDCSECAKSLASNVFEASTVRDRIRATHVSVPLSDGNVARAVPKLELRSRSILLQNTLAA